MNRMADQIFQNESATKNPRFSQPNRALVLIAAGKTWGKSVTFSAVFFCQFNRDPGRDQAQAGRAQRRVCAEEVRVRPRRLHVRHGRPREL